MLKEKRNKGITLIALIITIIVLLILAGVTISAITGNESVMEKAQQAKEKTDIASEKEGIQLAIISAMANKQDVSEITEGDLNELSPNYFQDFSRDIDHWDVTGKTGNEFIIKDNGTVLTIDEFNKEIEGYADITCSFEVENAELRKIRYYIYDTLVNQNVIIQGTGMLLYRGVNLPKELLLENFDGSEILNAESNGEWRSTGTFRDTKGGVYFRPYIRIQYGNHTHVKYGEVIHTTFEEVANNQND